MENKVIPVNPTGIYVIGSLKNDKIPHIAKELRETLGVEVFDDWFSPGPEADDFWRKYEKVRGSSYAQALWHREAVPDQESAASTTAPLHRAGSRRRAAGESTTGRPR